MYWTYCLLQSDIVGSLYPVRVISANKFGGAFPDAVALISHNVVDIVGALRCASACASHDLTVLADERGAERGSIACAWHVIAEIASTRSIAANRFAFLIASNGHDSGR